MIKVDENDPVGEVELSFPQRDVQIKRGVDPKDTFILESEIGRGKFGTVYRCTEKSTGLSLAAKFIGCPKKEDRRNVEREIEIMKQLQHPRLIQIYDAFENGNVMTVILELIEGGELFERVIDDDFILTEKSCTIFMRQICEGVEFIHKQRILHLDLKPENILCLTKTGNRIKIIDFGLARKFDPSKKLQVLFGTPEFVAPEIVNFDEIGYGTDMWSVGVICYVLLSGLSPFMGHTDVETMANVTIAKYDFDDEAFEEISENAKDFIRKLLIKDMSWRLSASECLDHEWLRRRKPPPTVLRAPSMDVTKDNLKQFVDRWTEHPNSPYVFEVDAIVRGRTLSDSSESLLCESPSPCGSLDSCPGSVDDVSEEGLLAEEIRKLSDKLFRLSNFDPTLAVKPEAAPHQESSGSRGVPWRRSTKFKVGSSSRDVPLAGIRSIHHKGADGTKNLLLQLLDHWDGPSAPSMRRPRHGSVSSSEWTENDSLMGHHQRTISSLNTFFQSRASNKKITAFHLNKC